MRDNVIVEQCHDTGMTYFRAGAVAVTNHYVFWVPILGH